MDRKDFERLLDMTLIDDVLSEQEQRVLIEKANETGITPDELQIMIDAKMAEKRINQNKEQTTLNQNQILVSTISSAIKAGTNKGRPTKCPNCGAPLDSYTSHCPDCGLEIIVEDSVRGMNIDKFSELLASAKTIGEKFNVINYAAIPATKTGLLDFCTFVNAQFKTVCDSATIELADKSKLCEAWVNKSKEILIKAEIVLKNDKSSLETIKKLVEEVCEINDIRNKNVKLFNYSKYGCLALGILLMVLCFPLNSSSLFLFGIFLICIFKFVMKPKLIAKFLPL
jgi:hypothetical protein